MKHMLLASALVAAAVLTLPAIVAFSPDGAVDSAAVAAIKTPAPANPGVHERTVGTIAEHQATLSAPAVTVTIPACFTDIGGSVETVETLDSPLGVGGTTSDNLDTFARAFNAIRVANCLPPIALANFHYDACMEQRLFWMAEDPSEDPLSAWGHLGSQRSDGVPSVGCDGNLAGGSDNDGATVAQKWWDSLPHRASLYRPGDAIAGVCIAFAMTHGGVPNESYTFVRASARWVACSDLP